jgi:hypothetical protein
MRSFVQSDNPGFSFFSPTFHTAFFLPLLFRKLKPQKNAGPHSFAEKPFEYTILPGIAIACMVFGLTNYQSMIGLVIGIPGAGGFFMMLLSSIRSRIKIHQKMTWEDFRPLPFLFLVLAGFTISLVYTGGIAGAGVGVKITGAAVGLLIGYMSGIPAGFWFQSIGWMLTIIEIALVPLMIGFLVLSTLMALA